MNKKLKKYFDELNNKKFLKFGFYVSFLIVISKIILVNFPKINLCLYAIGNFCYDLGVGYIISLIFYFIVVHIKEVDDKIKMYKLIDNNMNFVNGFTKLFFERLREISSSIILYKKESNHLYHEGISSINYPPSNEEISKIYNIILTEPERETIKNRLIGLMDKDLANIKNKLKETITCVNDNIKVIELINKLLQCELFIKIDDEQNKLNYIFSDDLSFGKSIFEYFTLLNEVEMKIKNEISKFDN